MFFFKLNAFSQINGKNLEKVSSYKYLGNKSNCTRLLSGDIFKENADKFMQQGSSICLRYDR